MLPASSSNVDLKILDPVTNQVISVRSLGEQPAGALSFVWDGKTDKGEYAPKGVYKVQVDASIDGINTVLQPAIQARVESVSINGAKNDLQVNLAGLGAVNFNQIKQIN